MRWIAPLSLALNVVTLLVVLAIGARPEPVTGSDLFAVESAVEDVRSDVRALVQQTPGPADTAVTNRLDEIAGAISDHMGNNRQDEILDDLSSVCARLDDLTSDLTDLHVSPALGC